MSKVIRIPANVYARLEKHAKGFVDTPGNVIERLLNYYDGDVSLDAKKHDFSYTKKDTTKYIFNERLYGKGRLVLAVLKEHISNNVETSFDELLKNFPKNIQGSLGVFNRYKYVQEKYTGKKHKRHFFKADELIELSDKTIIAVCTEWGTDNINNFIQQAQSLGYLITSEKNES